MVCLKEMDAEGRDVNVRGFLRDFAALKEKARSGQMIRIRDRDGEFLFTAVRPEGGRKTLLGAAKGRLLVAADVAADLTAPTLSAEAWKPSL